MAIIQKRITIVDSAHPFFSKWWCIGAILKILFPVNLKEITWIITDAVSNTNNPPIIAKTISCLTIMAMAARDPPKESDPVSPIKILAGGALYQRNPKHDPTIEPQKIESSPTSGMYWICKYSEKIVLPTTYEIKVKESATNITGTVANPSKPSVKLTAFEAPIITNKPKGMKNNPICQIKFLKKGK